MKKAIVIGAGFTGCMFAMMLKEKNWNVKVFDKSNLTGGGVRTFYHGGHPFTYGPRHFIGPESSIKAFEFLDKIVPMRHLKKMNLSYQQKDDFFANYPIFEEDLKKLSDSEQIFNELNNLPKETKAKNYDGYNKFFDVSLNECEVLLGKNIQSVNLEKTSIMVDSEEIKADLIISTVSPDFLFNNCWGELKYVGRDFYKIVLPIKEVLPKDVYFLYYPNKNEQQTRVTEFKKFTNHKSDNSLITLEVPSMKNKLYPTMIKEEIDLAKKYLDALPKNIMSVGRMGTYRYVDIDDIVLQGLKFKESI